MVSYWDTSAILPLLAIEAESPVRSAQLLAAQGIVTWWGTRGEALSALCRREREGSIDTNAFQLAMARLDALSAQWSEVAASDLLRSRSERLLRVHPLRAADAWQLAAALLATNESTTGSTFHTSDLRLAEAARKEGFSVC
jgi:predicted nucleic acid-binding protein